MKRISRIILVLFILAVAGIFVFDYFEDRSSENKETAVESADDAAGQEETYVFLDVEGNVYNAPLLGGVPECTYDPDCLVTDEKTGYKHYTDEKNHVTAKPGIDVSEFQGEEIDWKKVRDAGFEFVILRLGYRAYGESGALVLDAMYEENVKAALDAGLEVGVYFFSQAITDAEAEEEAQFVLDHIRPYNITGPVVYDTEEIKWDTYRAENNTSEEYTKYCRIFCDAVEAAGYEPMIYCNMKWMAFTLDMEELAGYDFWYADYYDVPQCPYDYKIWQYSETGVVPGINGNVDLNLWFQEGE